ncbi:F-box only protein 5-like [Plakobranchus ocellatus]|uniref:F-box only protein 5-like n=1 Tax=Plakobranchus ocellatus TaxID=259542 RepID=A0AAV4B016_9GAST|nr:F-box only protein 5-like [Plakobranchus ocellatus]
MWRQALEGDIDSFHRFRCYQSDMANKRKSQACQGKENESEKYIDELKATPMTESKGCLTSLQLQADIKPPPPLQEKPKEAPEVKTGVMWGDQLRHCPSCQHPALVRPHEGRAICMDSSCGYDFCTLCFSAFHHPKPCKPLNRSVSKKDVAGTHKSRKSLKRL